MNWLDSINIDWPISRRRYYGTEIPIWYCKNCSEPHVPEPGKYYKPWNEKCPISNCVKCDSTEFVGEERTFDTWMDSSVSPLFVSVNLTKMKNSLTKYILLALDLKQKILSEHGYTIHF